MYHVHTSTLSSSTTTTEPVSSLSPSVLFPFFQPASSSSSSSQQSAGLSPSCQPSPSTGAASSPPSSAFPAHHTSTTSSTTSCPCLAGSQGLPSAPVAPPTFITLPSANPHQSVILPLPQPSPPPAAAAAVAACPPSTAAGEQFSKSPLLVFSHGSTQVDTFVPSTQCLQRTLYSWSQLSDYTVKHCWNLPAASSSSTQSCPSAGAGQPAGHNVSINNSNGRLCQGDDVARCPGHPWVNFSYHMQVKQWQERKEDALAAAAAAAASATQQSVTTFPTTVTHQPAQAQLQQHSVKALDVRVANPRDILAGLRRRREEEEESDAGSMFDDVDEGDEADEEDNWNELCSTTEDDSDDYELTDIDM